MRGEQLDDGLVPFAVYGPRLHIDGELSVGADLDQRALAASGFDSDDDRFTHGPAARVSIASSTPTCSGGTPMCITVSRPAESNSNVKNEQHWLSRRARSLAAAPMSTGITRSSRVGCARYVRRTDANRSSNSVTRIGRSAVRSVHASGDQSSAMAINRR